MMRIINRCILFMVFLFLISFESIAQEKLNPKNLFIEAESFFLFEEYKEALPFYQQIIRLEPDNFNVVYKIGICYLNDIYLKQKSIKYFEQASLHADPSAVTDTYREKKAPLEAYFYLGKAYRVNNMLDEAIKSYEQFLKLANPIVFDIDIVYKEIQACKLAKKVIADPDYFEVKNAGSIVNSRFAEKNAVISGDGKTLVFTRELQFYEGVFITKKDAKGNWSEPVNLTPDFGLDGSSTTTGISYLGDEIFVYRSDQYDGNIYSSKLVAEKWSKLEKLNDYINTKFWESHASPSPDGKFLYFTSNRSGGYGGLDIYKSPRETNGTWGPPLNLGPVINSSENEDTPFLSNDGYTLFYSSQGQGTIGGYDIFISNLQSNGNWGLPKNMGYPLNTTDDDLFYCPTGINSFGYYSMYAPSTTEGMTDIYLVEVYNEIVPRTFTLNGKCILPEDGSRLFKKILVKLYNSKTNQLIAENNLDKDGTFSLKVNQGDYTLIIEGGNFQPYSKNFTISVTQPDILVEIPDILLTKTTVTIEPLALVQPTKSTIIAKNDFFAVNDSSAVAIDLLLPKDADLKVEIFTVSGLIDTVNFMSVNRHFTYMYKPKPGENILKFTATDKEGNISTTEVKVNYYLPVVPDEMAVNEFDTLVNAPPAGVFGLIATGKLSNYLLKLDQFGFDNLFQLYNYLLEHAKEEGYNKEDITRIFSVYYTQKNLTAFDREFKNAVIASDTSWDQIRDSSTIPLHYIDQLLQIGIISDVDLTNALLKILYNDSGDGDDIFSQLNAYSDTLTDYQKDEIKDLTPEQLYKLYEKYTSIVKAKKALTLSATTDKLSFFYQNLLLASSGNLKNYLSDLQFSTHNILTSIDLVDHLITIAVTNGFTIEELFKTLDLVSANRKYYLVKFVDELTADAKGTLKSQLLVLDLEESNIYTYDDLLNYLLDQSQYKNYSRESVYDLFLRMIGIDNVEEFADLIRSYQNASINKALADTSLGYFSSPFELLQYLLASTQYYEYTESDINNMLIRMILERGLSLNNVEKYKGSSQKLWRNPKFVPTIVLINIILLVLIIVVLIKRKNNS